MSSGSQPVYGKCADAFGRRACFLTAIFFYLIGSVLCSCSQSMIMFITARGFCGLGIGAFDSLMKIVVADYIPVRYIGYYQAMLGASWGLGYLVGALLGGLAVERAGWRAVFYMTTGICVVALLMMFAFLEAPKRNVIVKDELKRIDYLGIVLWFTGVVCLVLGLSWGGSTYAWNSATVLSLLCVSVAVLALFTVWERCWAPWPMIPRRIFNNRSSVLILAIAFAYGGCFQSLMTYVPIYLSVILNYYGSALTTNLELLCLVLFACIANICTGIAIVKSGHYTWAIRSSMCILVLACGLMQLFQKDSSVGLIVGLMVVAGIGSGGMINSEIIAAQGSVVIEHVPIIVTFMTFCDQVGGVTGITVASSVFYNTLGSTFVQKAIPSSVSIQAVRQSSAYMYQLPQPEQTLVLDAYTESIRTSYFSSLAFAAFGLLLSFGLKAYVMRKHVA
ncbi:MFS general substrate transporter [Hesseltinella vesiculosa]|uniref:MFS general substrate transporter n=1 Tax=Hesseltinella vesiculosa TaxID=101127 RepID=A0A1X2GKU0_9FUNG|nr:MFS general substrate transporter [Hesseltinella vesiculosa]